MKISELPYVTTTTDSDYVLAVQNGQNVRATATAFKGDPGTNGVDGVGVPAGGVAGEVLKKVDGADYNTEWGPAFGVVDLTSATEDYSLSVGETAFIDYTSTTSVPLHIATDDGVYEISVYGDKTTTINNTDSGFLLPNSVNNVFSTYGSYIWKYQWVVNSVGGTGASASSSETAFFIGNGLVVSSRLTVSTFVNNKSVNADIVAQYPVAPHNTFVQKYTWQDTTTQWTSLGTITFPFAQSGKIVIKRVI